MISDDIPNASGVYRIVNIVNNKYYIGSAVNLRDRRRCHFKELRRNNHRNLKLQRAWNKYGEESFIFEVLELVLPIFLTAREQYWFNKLKPFGRNGYNILPTAGSSLGMKHTPEVCENMSQTRQGKKKSPEHIEKIRQSQFGHKRNLGRRHTPEAIEKISQSHIGNTYSLGHKHTPEVCEKLRQTAITQWGKTYIIISPDGIEYIVHNMTGFCKEHPGLTNRGLSKVVRGERIQYKGWKAHYATT